MPDNITPSANPAPSANSADDPRPPISGQWLERMRAKPEFLAKLFAVFLEDEPRRLVALSEAVANGDLELVRFLAHSIKGAGATLGMERLSDAARALEHAAKDGNAGALAEGCEKVRREAEAVFAVMRNLLPSPT